MCILMKYNPPGTTGVKYPSVNWAIVILTGHLYPVMKHFYADESSLFHDNNSPFTGHEDSLNGLICLSNECVNN